MGDLSGRKDEHIDLTLRGDVGFRRTTLLEEVELIHCSLPELSWDELRLDGELFGRRIQAPLVIASMTGGSARAQRLNEGLAEVAERGSYAIGLGSMRPIVKGGNIDREMLRTYEIRTLAPSVPLFANIGVIQAGAMSSAFVLEMVEAVGADALCIHLNPAQELIQPGGDRDFRGGLRTIERLVQELSVPVIVKETGNGLSRGVAERLRAQGVEHVDVSGSGGTSWVAVETHRATGNQQERGRLFWDWGIPTAASLLEVADCHFETVIATGGLKTGLDAARCFALGATAAGFARPVLQALDEHGVDGALSFLKQVEDDLRAALLLTGAKTPKDLRKVRKILGRTLKDWAES